MGVALFQLSFIYKTGGRSKFGQLRSNEAMASSSTHRVAQILPGARQEDQASAAKFTVAGMS